MSQQQAEELERYADALDHIMRVSRQANTMTNRLKWIDLRCKSALEETEEWRAYDYPRNRQQARDNLRRRYRDLRDLFVKLYDAQGDKFEDTGEQALEKAGL